MTQEEKQLLLKDICGRLPYGLMVHAIIDGDNILLGVCNDRVFTTCEEHGKHNDYPIECVKPYLRPLSSMTKEEREEVQVFICDEWFFEDSGFATKVRREGYIEFLANYDCSGIDPEFCGEYVDWLNSHNFDYRGLIEKGLGLEAPEGMYKTE